MTPLRGSPRRRRAWARAAAARRRRDRRVLRRTSWAACSAAAARVPGFANGGDFEVGGRGGVDRNVAVMRVSKGERVSVGRRGDTRGAPANVTVNISTPNPAAFERSRGQVAATISRAVARGQRNL